VVKPANVVLTRDAAGRLRAFSATCTHAGCQVDAVSAGQIRCPCHASRFDATTGEPVGGPANRPLPPVAVEVRNGVIFTE
jgi:Rieske Fe-S protein